MGLFSRFESKAEDVIEDSGSSGRGGIEPVKLAKRACKEMEREKMVGVGHEYAPTLYNILVSTADDERMSGYYPTLAGEIETYLQSSAGQANLTFDCPPLVRFIVDEGLKRGKFDIIAESVSPAIIEELRHEEMVHYGIEKEPAPAQPAGAYSGYYADSMDPFAPSTVPPQQAYNDFAAPAPAPAPTYEPEPEPEPAPAYEPQPAPTPAVAPAAAGGAVAGAAASAAARTYPPVETPGEAAERQAATVDHTVILGASQPQRPRATLTNRNTGARHELASDRITLGREATCDVTILDPSVSRRHAEILHSDSGWLVRDTGSTNGTSVNGTMTTQARIYDGDVLDLGKTQLVFREG